MHKLEEKHLPTLLTVTWSMIIRFQ